MKVWTFTETSLFNYNLETDVRLFKDETAAREYFNERRDAEMNVIRSWNKQISNDIDNCGDGDIYLYADEANSFGYYEYGYSNDCEFFMRLEVKEVK